LIQSLDSLSLGKKQDLVGDILDKKEGVIDMDWAEMVAEYQLDISPDTLRKAAVGVKLAEDARAGMDTNIHTAPAQAVETPAPDAVHTAEDGYTERQKLYDLRREIRKDLREQSRSELLREMIRDAVRDLPPFQWPDIKADEPEADDVNQELVVGMGDFHYGAEYTVTGLYGEQLNKFNPEIFVWRLNQLRKQIVDIAAKEKPCRITIMIVGDMLDGILRPGQLTRLAYGAVESAIRLSEILSDWLAELCYEANIPIRVYAVRGNHGEIRPLGTKAGQFPEENLERVVMHYLYERFRENPYVMIGDNDAPMNRVVDVLGYKFLLIHGQGDDIEKIARDHMTLYGESIDTFMCGHLHKSQTFTAGMNRNGNILIERVPSMCGMDPYAQSKGFGSPPGATIIVMREGYGRRCVYPIVLR